MSLATADQVGEWVAGAAAVPWLVARDKGRASVVLKGSQAVFQSGQDTLEDDRAYGPVVSRNGHAGRADSGADSRAEFFGLFGFVPLRG